MRVATKKGTTVLKWRELLNGGILNRRDCISSSLYIPILDFSKMKSLTGELAVTWHGFRACDLTGGRAAVAAFISDMTMWRRMFRGVP